METWYEIIGYATYPIGKRLVSSETACYVFHPSGRKSRKADDRGNVDWHKTFDAAKTECLRRNTVRIETAQRELAYQQERHKELEALTEASCSKTS
jgi:hypothetical protein